MHTLQLILIFFAVLSEIARAEFRTWTDVSGRKIEAEFVSQTTAKVFVKLKEGREVSLDRAKLGKNDQDFLNSLSPSPPNPPAVAKAAGFTDARIDKRTWTRPSPPRNLRMAPAEFPVQIETEHFFIAGSPKIRPDMIDVYAEACERLYVHLTKYTPRIAELFKERRMAAWITQDKASFETFGEWLNHQPGGRLSGSYEETSISPAFLTEEIMERLKVRRTSRVFQADVRENQRSLKWSGRIHFISGDLFDGLLSQVRDNGEYGSAMLSLGYCYYMEGDICGNITTEIVFGDGPGEVKGFRDGRAWPATIKTLLKNPAVRPGIEKLLKTEVAKAQPIDVGATYGFYHWCFHDPARNQQFNAMLDAAINDQKMPDAEAFARAFGFENAGAFDAAFVAYLKSDRFK